MVKKKKNLLKLSDAAELLNVHPNTLRQWDKNGILKAIRFGARKDRRYNRDDLLDLIKNKQLNKT